MLVRVDHVFLGDQLGYKLASGLPLLLELLTALWGGGVNAEHESVLQISVGEGVKLLLGVIKMTTISEPSWLGDFVIEETRAVTFAPLLKSEPVENVWLQSLTSELHWSPLTVQIVHSILPRLARISIKLPTVGLFGCGPVGDLESLEKSTRATIELDLTNTLKHCRWMEVLSIDVMHDVGLLVEFIAIEVLNSNTYIILN